MAFSISVSPVTANGAVTITGCTAGNMIIAGTVGDTSATITSPTCTGEVFNLRGTTVTSIGNGFVLQIADCIVATSGDKTITAHTSGGTNPDIWALEITPAGVYDNSTNGTTTGADPSVAVVVAGSGEFIVGHVCSKATPSAVAGYTSFSIAGGIFFEVGEYNVSGGASPVTVNFTAASAEYAMQGYAWKAAGAATPLIGQIWI